MRRFRRFTPQQVAAILAKARLKKFPNLKARRNPYGLHLTTGRAFARLTISPSNHEIYVEMLRRHGKRSLKSSRTLVDAILRSAVKWKADIVASPENPAVERMMASLGGRSKNLGLEMRIPIRKHLPAVNRLIDKLKRKK